MMINLIGKIILLILFAFPCFAKEVSVYETSCETIRGEERKTQTLARATDKAIFNAVANVAEVFAKKEMLDEHNFNIFVYDLVDNNVSDMQIKTTKSDDLEVCVEVNGFLNIDGAEEIVSEAVPEQIIPQEAIIAADKPFLFIAPTHYYNDTQSEVVSQKIAKNFEGKEGFLLTDKRMLADYVIYPKVLKAKIDPINSSTNRFHMIVSLELEDVAAVETTKEHQNKFILLDANDDEQQKAKELMDKLFKTASVGVLAKLETLTYKKSQDPNNLPELFNAGNISN